MTENGLRVVDDGRDYTEDFAREKNDEGCLSHPLLWTNPVTGRTALQPHSRCMLCLESDGTRLGVVESRILLEKLMAPAIVPSRVYGHGYEPGNVAVWDNFSIWHSATGGLAAGDRRVIHMASFNGSVEPRLS